MVGCLVVLVIIFFIGLIITFPLTMLGVGIGISLIAWGIHEYRINKHLGAKSFLPVLITFTGTVIILSGLLVGTTTKDTASDNQSSELKIDQEPRDSNSNENHSKTNDEKNDSRADNSEKEETDDSQQEEPPKNQDSNEHEENDLDGKDNMESQAPSEDENNQNKPTKPEETDHSNLKTAIVTRVVDGDTIEVKLNGKIEDVRLLLVDTPETVHPSEPVQPFGPEASDTAKQTLSGEKINLEYDGPKRDNYDRLLAYVWIGDDMFNQMLLEKGLARLAYVYDPPYKHYKTYMKAQNRAKSKQIGIWSIDDYVHQDGFYRDNNSVQQESETYKNCAEVREAGVSPIHKGDPGYGSHLDGDGDGIACE